MVHPQVADGGDSLQLVGGNILNKESQASNKGWSFSMGVG